jgi:stage II sporulation protein D
MRRTALALLAIACALPPSSRLLSAPAPQSAATSAGTARTLRVGIAKPGGGYNVTTMPLEAYVARVIAGEAARDSAPSALEALAITIRTFALANLNRHRADGFDLCDQTHCQVVRTATASTDRAARATAGRVLLYDGAPASIYYGASCGGRTEIPSHVWPGADDPPFLPSHDDDACGGAPAWSATIEGRDLQRALRGFGFRGDRLRDVRVAKRNASGRVSRVKVAGLEPEEISGQDLRVAVGRTLGWQLIKSTAFEIRREGGAYRLTGHGSGHGVGMCVIGAAHLGAQGKSAESILARYFPGLPISPGDLTLVPPPVRRTEVTGRSESRAPSAGRVAPGDGAGTERGRSPILVSLPDLDEGERSAIVAETTRARDDLARALGVPLPPRVTLRFHPTTDDYERTTGRAWFTSGALIGDELHLLPVGVLHERAMLDRTIRHELVHLMADAILKGRPLWVREGAAIHFAGDLPPAAAAQRPAFRPDPRAACPDDNELLHPLSVGALSNAYARARACFDRQIAAGKSWRDVK